MRKPLILLTGGQARDRQFHGVSFVVNHTYVNAIVAAGGTPVLALDPDAAEEYAQLADGLLCTGTHEYSPLPNMLSDDEHQKRNVVEHRMMDAFLKAGKPIMGVCLGMQRLNVQFGGTVYKDFRLTDGVEHRMTTHYVDVVPDSILGRLFGTRFDVNSYHAVRVDQLAPDLRVTALSPDGVIEAFEHKSLKVMGCQFHPERTRGDLPDPPTGPDMTPVFKVFVDWCRTQEEL